MTNLEIVKKIISNSIWLLSSENNANKELLSKMYMLFLGEKSTNFYSYRTMINLNDFKNKTLYLFFREKKGITYNSSFSKSNNKYNGLILLDYDSLLVLNEFIDMDESAESINYLLEKIDFKTELDKDVVIKRFKEKYGDNE